MCRHIAEAKDGEYASKTLLSLHDLKDFLVQWKGRLGRVIQFLYEDVMVTIQMKANVNNKETLESCKHVRLALYIS